MTEIASIRLDKTKLVEGLTFKVTIIGETRFALRVWLATKLFALAAWIMGGRSHLEFNEDDKGKPTFNGLDVFTPEGLPARFSVYSPDYDPAIGRTVLVRLEGEEIENVVAYDTVQGRVWYHDKRFSADIIVDDGVVTVERRPDADDATASQ